MVRLILGIILCLWSFLGILGWIITAKPLNAKGVLGFLIFIIPGILLIIYGSRTRKRKDLKKSDLDREKETIKEKTNLSPSNQTIQPKKDLGSPPIESIIQNPQLLDNADFSIRYNGIKALRDVNSQESRDVLQKFNRNHIGIDELINVPSDTFLSTFCMDKNLYATPNSLGIKIEIFDLITKELKYSLQGPGSITCMSFSPNGLFIGVGSSIRGYAEYISIYEFEKSKIPIKKFHNSTGIAGVLAPALIVPTWGTSHVVFSPDSKSIAIGAENGNVSILELNENKPRKFSSSGYSQPHDLCFSHNGKLLAQFTYGGGRATSTNEKSLMKVWDVDSGNEKFSFEGGPYSIYHKFRTKIYFSFDDRFLAAGGHEEDKTIKIWDISSGELLSSFEAHQHAITSLIFSKDNKYLLSGSKDSTLKLWSILDSQNNLRNKPILMDHIKFNWVIEGKMTLGKLLKADKPPEIEKLIYSQRDDRIIAVYPCGLSKSGDPNNRCLVFITLPEYLGE
jgi:WD40 repeat protein